MLTAGETLLASWLRDALGRAGGVRDLVIGLLPEPRGGTAGDCTLLASGGCDWWQVG